MVERSADVIDQAAEREAQHNAESQAFYRRQAAPELYADDNGQLIAQIPREDGTYPFMQCVEDSCGDDLHPARLQMGRVRCVHCQALLEKGRRHGSR